MPWYAMGLSIMATQASAITFISTTGQAYVDGMRFVQFYFGLPVAMVILSATAVPIFHRAKVYTAYEYLEQRFDAKTRVAGDHHLSDRTRPGRGHCAGGARHRDVGGAGVAVQPDHDHHGRTGDSVHDPGRNQGRHLGRRAADDGDHGRAGAGAGDRGLEAAARCFVPGRGHDRGRGGEAERGRYAFRSGTTATTCGAA